MTRSSSREIVFPYQFPQYLSSILRILGDGRDHGKEEIRALLLAEFPLTPEQLGMLPARSAVPVFLNKVAFAFNRLVYHHAIEAVTPGSYRITDHGREVLNRCPTDAREKDL